MDDQSIAQILAQEARESSQKYSAEGLSALLPRRPAGNAPKPNTRFLRHLIKATDNHNTGLKRKEEKESRERMRHLRDQSTTGSASTLQLSKRHDQHSSTRDSNRHDRYDGGDRYESSRRRHRSRSSSAERDRSRRHRRREEEYGRRRDGHRERESERRRRERHRHESSRTEKRRRERSYSRSRSRSPGKDRKPVHYHSERRSRRYESPSGTRDSDRRRERVNGRSHRRDTSPRDNRTSRSPRKTVSRRDHDEACPSGAVPEEHSHDESDPLEDLVGPLPPRAHNENEPPLRSRGRGAYKPNSSTIDAHFAPDYDPTLDVHRDIDDQPAGTKPSRRPVTGLMTEEDDWDMALEALRDRAIWKQKGEDRLRAAGMDDETIDRWKSNAAFAGMDGEGKAEDVRWSKKGEGREWDRGKVMDDEGHIDVQAAWR